MKYLKWVSWGTLLTCAVLLTAMGFAAGRLTAPAPKTEEQEEPAAPSTLAPSPRQGELSGALPQATGSEAEQEELGQVAQQPVTPAFLLRREGESLVILQAGEVLTAFGADWSQIPEEEMRLLEEGIPFETLADIESFLEGYDS